MSNIIVPRNAAQVLKLTEEQKTELLVRLIEKLDELDEMDELGPSGWRHRLMNED